MELERRLFISAVSMAFFLLLTASLTAQVPGPAPVSEYVSPPVNYGFVPPPMDLSYLEAPSHEALKGMLLPAKFDWRVIGKISSVKDQNPYGTCWAFAAIANLESRVLIDERTEYDYSEFNIVACNPQGKNCNSGGNAWISTNYLSLLGSVYESCDPYPGDCATNPTNPTCKNPSCTFRKRVTEWLLIANSASAVDAIKNAILNFGPVYTTMYAGFSSFQNYDGSYCLTYSGDDDPNHAVLLVGWDDKACDGKGAWIGKNSWGTSWGDNGFFEIKYGDAKVGEYTSVISNVKDYDPNENIYHYDEWGWWTNWGYGDQDYAYIFIEFVPTRNEKITAVNFWAVSDTTDFEYWIYDDYSGGKLSDLLASGGIQTLYAGYYTLSLMTGVYITTGDTTYVKVKFQTTGYNYPVPADNEGPVSGKCFTSRDGSAWSKSTSFDFGVRITTVESAPTIYIDQDSITYVERGQSAAYIPFSICNDDACAPCDYVYNIVSTGYVGPAIDVTDTVKSVNGGECATVYGVIDAGTASICDYDTLTIIAWSVASPVVYDTCVQLIHVVEPVPVPLFTALVVTVLVLALVLAAAVYLRKRAGAALD